MNILHTIQRRTANWTVHILHRNFLIKHVIERTTEGIIEGTGKQERRCKQIMDKLKKTRGYCKLKEAILDRTVCRTRYGSGHRLSSVVAMNLPLDDLETIGYWKLKQETLDRNQWSTRFGRVMDLT
jgi:hypothetical protein